MDLSPHRAPLILSWIQKSVEKKEIQSEPLSRTECVSKVRTLAAGEQWMEHAAEALWTRTNVPKRLRGGRQSCCRWKLFLIEQRCRPSEDTLLQSC